MVFLTSEGVRNGQIVYVSQALIAATSSATDAVLNNITQSIDRLAISLDAVHAKLDSLLGALEQDSDNIKLKGKGKKTEKT
jgi:hypothetical protein